MLLLPDEIITYISNYLDRLDRHMFSMVCSRLRNIFGVDYFDMMGTATENHHSSIIVWLHSLGHTATAVDMETLKTLHSLGYVGNLEMAIEVENSEDIEYACNLGYRRINYIHIIKNNDMNTIRREKEVNKVNIDSFPKVIQYGSLEMFKYLCDKEVYAVDFFFNCGLAAKYGRLDILKWFYAENSIIMGKRIYLLYETTNSTVLDWLYRKFPTKDSNIVHDAILLGDMDKLRWLINKGFNIGTVKSCKVPEVYSLISQELGVFSSRKYMKLVKKVNNPMRIYINAIGKDDNYTRKHSYLWNDMCTDIALDFYRYDLIEEFGCCNISSENETTRRWLKNQHPEIFRLTAEIEKAREHDYWLPPIDINSMVIFSKN